MNNAKILSLFLLTFIFIVTTSEGNDNKITHLPTVHLIKCLEYLKNPKVAKDREFIRFLTDYPNSIVLAKGKRVSNKPLYDWIINQLHLEPDATPLKEIFDDLYAIDLRDYGWNSASWAAVAQRETYLNEPFFESNLVIELHELTKTNQDPNTLHPEAIVRADWFFREVIELDRSASYHDLLFSKFRFIEDNQSGQSEKKIINEDWAGGIDPFDGKYYPPGKYTKEIITKTNQRKFKFVDFPKNEKDFEHAFGVDKIFDFIKESGINPQKGAVVEGGEKNVSIVSRNNRLLAFTKGPIGIYSKTFDVTETSGKKDFTETLNKDFDFDAGEIITDLPSGGFACALVDNKGNLRKNRSDYDSQTVTESNQRQSTKESGNGNILKVADNKVANDSSDYKFDTRVRTPGSCYVCHESGYIKPNNFIEEMLSKGVDIKFKNKRDQIEARAFFLNWGEDLDSWQKPHIRFAKRLFLDTTPKRVITFKAFRDNYDSSVNLEKAINELGITKEQFIIVAAKSTKARINNLVVGLSMPRRTWEIDGFKEMVRQLNSLNNHKP